MVRLSALKPNIRFHLQLNVLVVIFITGASYVHTPLNGWEDRFVYFIHLCILQSTIAGGLYFLSLSRLLFKLLFSLLFLAFSGFAFWGYSQDLSITKELLHAILETKPDIAVDTITWPFAAYLLLATLGLVYILRQYKKTRSRASWMLFTPLALLCVGLFFFMEQMRPGSLKNRLPYNVYYGIKDYASQPQLQLNSDIQAIRTRNDSIHVVFVLGETVRADHLSLNGYHRATMPILEERERVISFSKLWTEHTYTGASVPQILTDQNLQDTIGPYTAIYSLANKAGIGTTWIGNQTLEDSFEPIVNTNDRLILIDAFKSEFSFAKAMDTELFRPLDSILELPGPQLTTLHTIGSHWWYENRYLQQHRHFTPVIDSKYVPSLDAQSIINSYDNTLVYLDDFLNQLIGKLELLDKPTVMVYVSDHGESLGEEGRWLHAQKGDEAKNPGFIVWYSELFECSYPEQTAAWPLLKDSPLTTDVVYPFLADLLSIVTH